MGTRFPSRMRGAWETGRPRRGARASSLGGAVLGGQELAGVEVAHHLLGDLRQDALSQRFSGSLGRAEQRQGLAATGCHGHVAEDGPSPGSRKERPRRARVVVSAAVRTDGRSQAAPSASISQALPWRQRCGTCAGVAFCRHTGEDVRHSTGPTVPQTA